MLLHGSEDVFQHDQLLAIREQEPNTIGNKLRTTRWDKVDFSPIHTPEQIAAKKREQDIERLAYEIAGYMGFDAPPRCRYAICGVFA